MSPALTIRLTDELLTWLKEMSRRTGIPVGRIIRYQLERAKAEKENQRFLSLAGKINGPSDLSSQEGFPDR
jgi:predicted DNA-binding protein